MSDGTRDSERKARRPSRADRYAHLEPEADGTFAFIVGDTCGGAPDGMTWEEQEDDDGSREPNDSNPF